MTSLVSYSWQNNSSSQFGFGDVVITHDAPLTRDDLPDIRKQIRKTAGPVIKNVAILNIVPLAG